MRYEFKNLKTGRVCCAGDSTPPYLCPACLAQFKTAVARNENAHRNAPLVANQSRGSLTVAVEEPPAPPSLVDRIAGRVLPTAPAYGGGQRLTVNARPSDGVDDPPSLCDAIAQSRRVR